MVWAAVASVVCLASGYALVVAVDPVPSPDGPRPGALVPDRRGDGPATLTPVLVVPTPGVGRTSPGPAVPAPVPAAVAPPADVLTTPAPAPAAQPTPRLLPIAPPTPPPAPDMESRFFQAAAGVDADQVSTNLVVTLA